MNKNDQPVDVVSLETEVELLRICQSAVDLDILLSGLIPFFKKISGCESVGIRLQQNSDFPYIEVPGFPKEFLDTDQYLCSNGQNGEATLDPNGYPKLRCICGLVLNGNLDLTKPSSTSSGSFWVNSVPSFLSSLSEKEKSQYKDIFCHQQGYESLALIPINAKGRTIGLFQFMDHEKGVFNLQQIKALEQFVNRSAVTIANISDLSKLHQSEIFFRSFIENASDIVYAMNTDGIFTYVSPRWKEILGDSTDDPVGKSFADYAHPDDIQHLASIQKDVIETEKIFSGIEFRVKEKNGNWLWYTSSNSPNKDENGNLIGVFGIARDITDRKKDIEDLRKSEYKFSKIFLTSPDGIAITRLQDGLIVDVNDGYLDLFGFTLGEIKLKTTLQLNIWEHNSDRTNLTQQLVEFGELKNQEYSFRKKNGQLFTGLISARKIELDGEIYNLSVTRDISERKKMEDSLRKSEEWSRFILDHANDGIHIDTTDDQIAQVNTRFCEMMGYSQDELLKMHVNDLIVPGTRKVSNNVNDHEILLHGNEPFESINLHSSGRHIPVEVSVSKVDTPDGELYISIVRDITERKLNEEQTRKQEELIQKVFETVPVGIFIINAEGKIAQINPAGQQIWEGVRYSELDELDEYKGWFRSTGKRVEAHQWGSARAFEKGETSLNEEIEIECFNGEHKIISNSAVPLYNENGEINGAIVINQDITEKSKFDEEVQRRNAYLAALQESTYELIEELDLNKLLENITIRAGQMMHTSACFLDLIDVETGKLVPSIGLGGMKDSLNHTVKPGEGVAGVVWQTKEPFLVDDYLNWSGRVKDLINKNIKSLLGVPLLSGDEVLGVLGLAHEYSSNYSFDQESIDYIIQFARLATIAIKNARLFSLAQQELDTRKVAEKALRESELRFQQMFTEHNATMLLVDPESGEIIDANPAASKFYGYSLEKMKSMKIDEINMLNIEKIKAIYQDILDKRSTTVVFPHRLSNGEVRTVELHSSPIDLWNKKVLFSIVHDITERSMAEKQIQTQLDELRRWHAVTIGRESRVMELKYEVNDLLAKNGDAPRYQFTKEPEDD